MKRFFEKLFPGRKIRLPNGQTASGRMKRIGAKVRKRLPKNLRVPDVRNIRLETVSEHSAWFRLGLLVLAILVASAIASRVIAVFLKPTYTSIPPKITVAARPTAPTEDLSAIEQRNIFDVENKIPQPFDQGLLDCMSQAKPSGQRMSLMGTIVMGDEALSVALVQDEGSGLKMGVKKDEVFFDGKYQAMKVERKRLCFQVKATQEMEFIEIPEEGGGLDVGGLAFKGKSNIGGITPVSENKFQVKQTFLESQINDLPNILQTAKAVPYMDPSGKMKGFLIQSIDPESVFAALGLGAGDVLLAVNDVNLDSPGKGLEAFQLFRGAKGINIKISRGGQETNLSYEVK